MRSLFTTALLLASILGRNAEAQTSREFFEELRGAGGLHPLAQLACFPAPGQELDTTFTLVAFSKDLGATLRKKGKPVPKEFLAAEGQAEKDRFLMQWVFRNGVQLHNEPETLQAVVGSKGSAWSADIRPTGAKHRSEKLTLRTVFSISGRYSRDVLVNGVLAKSTYGKCEPIE
jgi:hypothetical protein